MSKIEVNAIEPQCGTTLTVGASGDTVDFSNASVTFPSGTGTVNWDTTAKTASFTAVSGNGYFINTTSGAITVTLPAGNSGDIVSLADYTNTWQTNNVTVTPNGTDKIGGINSNATLATEGQSVTLVYVDSTEGWKNVQDSTSNVTGFTGITATGGTITTCGDFKIHTFTSPGTFCVSALSNNPTYNSVSYLVVAGGGGNYGGPGIGSGGGGGGGYRESKTSYDTYSASPLAASGGSPVSVSAYPITIGAGGGTSNGSPTSALSITSTGGGAGQPRPNPGSTGGSGGGGGDFSGASGGAGNTPPVSPPQGNPGFAGSPGEAAGGGGGAGSGGPAGTQSAAPGVGTPTSISGVAITHAAGGDGEGPGNSNVSAPIRNAGGHGMGSGGTFPGSPTPDASAKAGVVVIRYKYQ